MTSCGTDKLFVNIYVCRALVSASQYWPDESHRNGPVTHAMVPWHLLFAMLYRGRFGQRQMSLLTDAMPNTQTAHA